MYKLNQKNGAILMLTEQILNWVSDLDNAIRTVEPVNGKKVLTLKLHKKIEEDKQRDILKALEKLHPTGEFKYKFDEETYSVAEEIAYFEWHLPYSEEEKAWETTVENFKFSLPRTGEEFRNAGKELKNPLYHWKDEVARDKCKVVLIKKTGKGNRAYSALELKKEDGVWEITLAKSNMNRKPSEESKRKILAWAAMFSINAAECLDLR
jgi:hypothetical protein